MGGVLGEVGVGLVVGEGGEGGEEFVVGGGDDGGAVGVVGAFGCEGAGDGGEGVWGCWVRWWWRRWAWACRAGSVLAERRKGRGVGVSVGVGVVGRSATRNTPAAPVVSASTVDPPVSAGAVDAGAAACSGSGVCSGASSMMAWALVPLTPKAEMPARRGRSGRAGQGCVSVSRRTWPLSQSTIGVGSSTCRVLGSCSCRRACTILITPATPAAGPVWPRLDLTEPSQRG